MKVHIYCDSHYPAYGLAKSPSKWDQTIEIDDGLFAEINAVEAAYEAMQEKLEALSKKQNGPLG